MKVLVIDDDGFIRAMMVEVLLSEGYEVKESNDGADAIEKLKNEIYDIVVTDVVMPNISGMSVAEHIRDNKLSTAVLAISSHASDDSGSMLHLMRDYVDAILEKPFDADTFVRTVKSLQTKS